MHGTYNIKLKVYSFSAIKLGITNCYVRVAAVLERNFLQRYGTTDIPTRISVSFATGENSFPITMLLGLELQTPVWSTQYVYQLRQWKYITRRGQRDPAHIHSHTTALLRSRRHNAYGKAHAMFTHQTVNIDAQDNRLLCHPEINTPIWKTFRFNGNTQGQFAGYANDDA